MEPYSTISTHRVCEQIVSQFFLEIDDLLCNHCAENWQNRFFSPEVDLQGSNTRQLNCSAQEFIFSCQALIFDFCEWELSLMLIILSQGEIHSKQA